MLKIQSPQSNPNDCLISMNNERYALVNFTLMLVIFQEKKEVNKRISLSRVAF